MKAAATYAYLCNDVCVASSEERRVLATATGRKRDGKQQRIHHILVYMHERVNATRMQFKPVRTVDDGMFFPLADYEGHRSFSPRGSSRPS